MQEFKFSSLRLPKSYTIWVPIDAILISIFFLDFFKNNSHNKQYKTIYIYIFLSPILSQEEEKFSPIYPPICARFTISSTGSSSPAILRPLIDDYVGSNRAQSGNSRFPLLFVSIPLRAPLGPTTIPLFIHFYTFENLLWECSTCNYYAVVAASTPHPPIPWIVARKARDALSLFQRKISRWFSLELYSLLPAKEFSLRFPLIASYLPR